MRGLQYAYQPMQDLAFNFYGNYTRQTDIFNSAFNFNNGAIYPPHPNTTIPIILNPFGTTPGVNPIAFNQFTGGASVTKTIDQIFVSLAGRLIILRSTTDSAPVPFQTSHDGANYWAGRVGYMSRRNSTRSPKAMEFSNVLTITVQHERIQSYWGIGSDDPRVCSGVKSMADIRFRISRKLQQIQLQQNRL